MMTTRPPREYAVDNRARHGHALKLRQLRQLQTGLSPCQGRGCEGRAVGLRGDLRLCAVHLARTPLDRKQAVLAEAMRGRS
jgi:hypothetical protein